MVDISASLGAVARSVIVVDGQPTTTSMDIARRFQKRHDDLVRRIRGLLPQLPDGGVRDFAETPYTDSQNGKTYPAYRLTRDGFTLLAMGFTGKRALQFKLAYIDAFNRMERELQQPDKTLPATQLREPERMAEALSLSVSVAAAVQQKVAQAVLQGDADWPLRSWVLSFAWDSRTKAHTHPVLQSVPLGGLVLSKEEVINLMGDIAGASWVAMRGRLDAAATGFLKN